MTPRPDDDSFFRMVDPNVDTVTAMDVFRKVPQGRFQTIIIIVYTILFISTATLSYNFAFFLMP